MQKLDLLSQIFCLIQFSRYISRGFPLWLAQVGSNHRPRAYQARALACWAMSQYRLFLPISPLSLFNDSGGDEEIRTLDPLLAGQVLSQLSYTPKGFFYSLCRTLKIEQRIPIKFFELFFCTSVLWVTQFLFSTLILHKLLLTLGFFQERYTFVFRELSP